MSDDYTADQIADRLDWYEEQLPEPNTFGMANRVPKDGDTHVESFLPVKMWEEFRP